jgi:DNA-3-methyladenine glycosylase II
MPNIKDLILLCMIGFLGGFANLWLGQSFKLSEVSLVSPLKYLALVFGIIFGYFIWDEVPTIKTFVRSYASSFFFINYLEKRNSIIKKKFHQQLDMSKVPKYWSSAKKYLSRKDKVMKYLIQKYSEPSEVTLTSRKDIFYSLCKSIIGQQISVAAANSVFSKFKKKCKNKINARTVYKLTVTQLKSCGLSRQKAKGIKSLAKQTLNKTFNSKLIPGMSDEEAIIYLSKLRQIGRWSAEMILLFTYNRSNIWPIQDIGLLRAISKNYKKEYLPPEKYVNLLNKRFSPYCSVATWYLWRSIDPEPIQY